MNATEFDALRSQYDVVPIVRELAADSITPVTAFAAISDLDAEAFLFESVERGESLGRYSFAGFAPRRRLTLRADDPQAIDTLRREFVPLRVYREAELPPFFGGAVASFGYGAARWSERLPDSHGDFREVPDATVLFFDNVLVFDHARQRLLIVVNLFTDDARGSQELLDVAARRLDEVSERIRRARLEILPIPEKAPDAPFRASMTREQFVEMVEKGKEQIREGEIFQIVLSQRWETEYDAAAALTLYRVLRSLNPSPYMFLFRSRDCTLVGASPEMLVRVEHRKVELRPIAGTRPRGADAAEDLRYERELLADPKENAEHLMLVDLGRNDVGRVCETGSVKVTEFKRVDRYSHVMHLVSSVEGRLREELTPIDAFLSAFPAGTVTGAPKIRAMQLIDELEPTRRGPYAGAVAYVGFSGNLDSCIAIRTIVLHDGKASVQAGAGIVYDSVPESEHVETLNKSAALRRAISVAATLVGEPVAGEAR